MRAAAVLVCLLWAGTLALAVSLVANAFVWLA